MKNHDELKQLTGSLLETLNDESLARIDFDQLKESLNLSLALQKRHEQATDELRVKYPDNKWLAHIDEAIDRLIEICGVSRDVASRAVKAAVARR